MEMLVGHVFSHPVLAHNQRYMNKYKAQQDSGECIFVSSHHLQTRNRSGWSICPKAMHTQADKNKRR